MDKSAQRGFTLVELVVTLAVTGVLLSVGVPSFVEAIRESKISAQYNQVVGSLYLARSEAVKRRRFVTVCPRSTPSSDTCGGTESWKNGWIVFVDNTLNQAAATATVDDDDEILAIESGISGNNTITVFGSPASSSTQINDRAYVRYQAPGDANWDRASVVICDPERGSESSRAVNIVLTGDIRPGRKNAGETVVRDAFNRPISNICDS